jgi:hypothetical protein
MPSRCALAVTAHTNATDATITLQDTVEEKNKGINVTITLKTYESHPLRLLRSSRLCVCLATKDALNLVQEALHTHHRGHTEYILCGMYALKCTLVPGNLCILLLLSLLLLSFIILYVCIIMYYC